MTKENRIKLAKLYKEKGVKEHPYFSELEKEVKTDNSEAEKKAKEEDEKKAKEEAEKKNGK